MLRHLIVDIRHKSMKLPGIRKPRTAVGIIARYNPRRIFPSLLTSRIILCTESRQPTPKRACPAQWHAPNEPSSWTHGPRKETLPTAMITDNTNDARGIRRFFFIGEVPVHFPKFSLITSRATLPCSSTMVRCAASATSGSWVTTIRVVPSL